MKRLRNIFGNVWVLLGMAAFAVSLAILWRHPNFGREEAIGGLIIFGIILRHRLGANEESLRRDVHPRRDRSFAELQRVRAGLGNLIT